MNLDPIRTAAESKLVKAEADVATWKSFLAAYDALRSETGELLPVARNEAKLSAAPLEIATGVIGETQSAAVEILNDAGQPLSTRELLAGLTKRGITIGGKDPPSTLSARLSRAPMLENVRPYGWRIKASSKEGRTEGSPDSESPSALHWRPNSADEDGQAVAHDNIV